MTYDIDGLAGQSEGDASGTATTSTTEVSKNEARQVGAIAKQQASAIAGTAMDSGKQVATEAKQQVRRVTDEAQGQLRNLVHQSRDELREHASAQASRAGASMQTLSEQMTALAQGRPEQSGGLADYVGQSGDRIGQYARRLQNGGADSVINDLTSFARRRPGLFLLGAVAAGFATGRLIRGAQTAGAGPGGEQDRPESAALPAGTVAAAGTVPAALSTGPAFGAPETAAVSDLGYADAAWPRDGGAAGEA